MDTITITMLGARGVGKTSLLTAMYQQFNATIGATNLQLRPDLRSASILEDHLEDLKCLTDHFESTSKDGYGLSGTESLEYFTFDIGKRGVTPTLQLRFADYPGGYLTSRDQEEAKKVTELLRDSAAVLIAIDAPALMEPRGKNKGRWNVKFNRPDHIAAMFESAYENLEQPRMVIFAPVKCEKYVHDPALAQELKETIQESYKRLFELFKSSEKMCYNVTAVITPVQTVGSVVFSHVVDEENGRDPRFHFKKEHYDDLYNPKDSEQSLRYLMRFLLRLHFDNRAMTIWPIFRFLHSLFLDRHLKDAVTVFAKGCKDSGEFEIVQGDHWLKIL